MTTQTTTEPKTMPPPVRGGGGGAGRRNNIFCKSNGTDSKNFSIMSVLIYCLLATPEKFMGALGVFWVVFYILI